MKPEVKAQIRWLSKEEGGRSGTPLHTHHVLVSRFDDIASSWPHEAWSLVIDFLDTPSSNNTILAHIRFLVPEGPIGLLYPGSRFDLLDGHTVVARGEVIAAT